MTSDAKDHWQRAMRALASARLLLEAGDHDGAASRAYYAAFHAFSAVFALEGVTHTKHTQLEAAVHRDLIRGGRIGAASGQALSTLREYRTRGDYGGADHVNAAAAELGVRAATEVIESIRDTWRQLDG